MLTAEVLIFAPIDRVLIYAVPDTLWGVVQVGSLVNVIVGPSKKMGLVVALNEKNPVTLSYALKPILSTVYDIPITDATLIRLYFWIAKYYLYDLFTVMDAAIPTVIRKNISFKLISYLQLTVEGKATIDEKKLPRQHEAWQFLRQNPLITKSEFLDKFSRNILEALLRKGIIYETFQRQERIAYGAPDLLKKCNENVILTSEQAQVVASVERNLEARTFNVHLLHGVTGSGKTEVYIELIHYVLGRGGSVLYLLPELALTAQVVEKLRSRFEGLPVLVWHSGLSDGERRDAWQGALNAASTVAVGARSAVFLPLNNLQLIIIDEEHESAYKQSEHPRYHGRDVAIYRATLHNAVCLLGSATPSIESYFNTKFKNYKLETLSQRIDCRQLPLVHVVDMRYERGANIFSRLLVKKMEERLEKGEQIILFLNRRGYAPTVLCKCCDFIAMCPHCSIPLTYHKTKNLLICHFCAHQEALHSKCPKCGAPEIFYNGVGTQRVEQVVNELFPRAHIARIDSDIMGKKHEFIHLLSDFREGKIDILVGTQMIAKGLDFPNVTLVGLLNADGSLNQQDFRANERTFQLLVQVAGRAGRGKIPGEVVVQTHIPGNEIIFLSKNANYVEFSTGELKMRKMFRYPPYRHIINVNLSGKGLELVKLFAKDFVRKLTELFVNEPIEIRGPMVSPLEKLQNRYRYSVLIFVQSVSKVAGKLQPFRNQLAVPSGIHLSFDVDALDFL
ncbi:MAG: primosomal protein N' [Puniceicoccales bacterium]|jgi:primosomal protein N' (replication factor Y)|nr:primosomal protein N' [Puniceicoccales bacterium]